MKRLLVVFCLLFSMSGLKAQQMMLEDQLVTCKFTNAKASLVLESIAEQTGVIFSYSQIDDYITIEANATPLKDVFKILSKELSADITLRGKYAIIKPKQSKKEISFSGKVLDKSTSLPIEDATVYIENLKLVSNTNSTGNYHFKFHPKTEQVALRVVKENFVGTMVILVATKDKSLDIKLGRKPPKLIADLEPLSIPSMRFVEGDSTKPNSPNYKVWDKIEAKNSNLRNITDTLISKVSFSLIPPICTNKLLSFNTRNAVAFNVIGGHSKGIDILELGGVYNLDYGDVKYVQMAGVTNIVKGDAVGVQAGGVFNLVKGDVQGLQVGGVFNNVSNVTGLQIGGVFNNTLFNMNGLQLAGVYQRAKYMNGLQVAGVYNYAQKVKGMQISGLVNQADTLSGVQIGVINISNHYDGGVPIGLINLVKDGYHKMELTYDELGFGSLGFRSGVPAFHTFLRVGMNSQKDYQNLVHAKFGIGTSISITKSFNFEAEIASGNIYNIDQWNDMQFNLNNHLFLGFSYQFHPKFGIRSGITFNHALFQPTKSYNELYAALLPDPVKTIKKGEWVNQFWIGYQVNLLVF